MTDALFQESGALPGCVKALNENSDWKCRVHFHAHRAQARTCCSCIGPYVRRTLILALRGLTLCFCTERSLPLEAAAPTAFWESRQNGICFYTDKCAAPITSWGTSSYLKVKLQSTVTCSLLPLSVFGIFPLVITKPLN